MAGASKTKREREGKSREGSAALWNLDLDSQFSPKSLTSNKDVNGSTNKQRARNSHNTFIYRACIQYVLRYYKIWVGHTCLRFHNLRVSGWPIQAHALCVFRAHLDHRVWRGEDYIYIKFLDFLTVEIYK